VAPHEAHEVDQAELPEEDAERVAALQTSGLLDGEHREALDAIAKRAADVFDSSMAVITTIDKDREYFVGQCGDFPASLTDDTGALLPMARGDAICNYVVGSEDVLVIPDVDRDPRFADSEAIKRWGVRFYAGYPLRSKEGFVFGAFCILDDEPRNFEEKDVQLLEKMAAEVGAAISDDGIQAQGAHAAAVPASATLGQQVPD
jgi:GAF domain-containing protein